MFGIYNSNAIVLDGIESVLASFSGDEFYKAAKELELFKITSKPLILVQTPSAKDDTTKTDLENNIKQFKDDATGKNLIVVQILAGNVAVNVIVIRYCSFVIIYLI